MKWPLEELQDHDSQLCLGKHWCHSQGPTCARITPACISETAYKSSVNLFKKPSKQAFLCGVGALSPCLCGFPPGAPVAPILHTSSGRCRLLLMRMTGLGPHWDKQDLRKKKKPHVSLVIALTSYGVCCSSAFLFHQTFSVLFWNGILPLLSDTFDFCPGVFPAHEVVWLKPWLFSAAVSSLNSPRPPCSLSGCLVMCQLCIIDQKLFSDRVIRFKLMLEVI